MLVSQLLTRNLPALQPDSRLEDIHPESYPDGIPFAPVVDSRKFVGFLPLMDLDLEMEERNLVQECRLETPTHFVQEDQHLFEVLPVFQKVGLPVLPVLDESKEFEGVLEQGSVISCLSGAFGFQTDGGTLVLSVPAIHYSLSEISRLVEANQGKVLSVLLESDPAVHQNYLVHLKINQPDLSRIVATLERFEYNVLEVHQKLEASSIDKDRFDQLMRYLGI
jgi:hypothetical protein